MDAWYPWVIFNVEYTSESSFLERAKKVIGVGFKFSGKSGMASMFDQGYPAFLVVLSTQNVAAGTLLPVLSTLDQWSWAGKFGTWHELKREINNARTQILSEIRLVFQGKIQSLAHTLLDSSYIFIIVLLIHMDA